uniref:F-box domain-containing protein n=1 Tax=Cajanus cajan TaxID=3821 RepID=A0A151SF07_CAJCA|nr:hypothetical protein KK1_024695 [Cajanus cajan]
MFAALVLPEELIMEILLWILVKALMRFSYVSKSWNSLMFTPTFVKLHYQRSSRNTHIRLHRIQLWCLIMLFTLLVGGPILCYQTWTRNIRKI